MKQILIDMSAKKVTSIRMLDQQIKREQDEVKKFSKQIDELKRQL